MNEGALSVEAMLTSLHDIRLPAEAPGGVFAEAVVAVGLAALTALLIVGLMRLFSQNRPAKGHGLGVRDRLEAIRALPEADRRVALLHVLRDHAPDSFAALRGELYRPGGQTDLARLEAEVARLV